MMTDTKQRKAAALEDIDDVWPKIFAGLKSATQDTIRELLQPSPQVSDSEVTNAIDILECMGKEVLPASFQNTYFASFDELKKAAQHPQREEWLDISSAPRDMTQVILYAYATSTSDHLYCVGYFSKGIWLSADDAEQFHNPTHWLPLEKLPSPPKAEK